MPLGAGRWTEVSEQGQSFSFQETKQLEDIVEIFDPGRNIRIRLAAGRSELSVDGRPFARWVAGSWLPVSRLPEFARLEPIDHVVRLIYFVPTDREPTANYRQKIRCLMDFVNSFYRQEFKRRGWPDRGLQFQRDGQGEFVVHFLRGKHNAAHYSGSPQYDVYKQIDEFAKEIPRSIGSPGNHLIVGFLETYDAGPHAFEWPGGVALGGQRSPDGGLAVFSSWILRDEFCATDAQAQLKLFQDETPMQGRTALGHGRPNSPRFEFIEDGFGAVIHEVGHALGLPHDIREDSLYIMANGFRQLRVNLTEPRFGDRHVRFSDANANFLRVSRHLSVQQEGELDQQPPEFQATAKQLAQGGAIEVSFQATDNAALACWQCYVPAYGSIIGGDVLNGASATQTVQIPLLKNRDEPITTVQLRVGDAAGNYFQTAVDVQAADKR
ncbi:MAG: hypothetical protein KDB14_04885 [Planctomycetales bacterium]|nr:hypothetical protein [Planctomycetales bacterium]